MAPNVPEEIDVFMRPHGRMKELVNNFTKKMLHSDMNDVNTLLELVSELHSTLLEFRRHEAIENVLILDRLKQRIRQHRKQPPPHLGQCHDDDTLPKLFECVRWCEDALGPAKHLYRTAEVGGHLHTAYTHFLQRFLPHMQLEEQEFQPLLMNHFDYNELKALNAEVWQQHQVFCKQNHTEAIPVCPSDATLGYDQHPMNNCSNQTATVPVNSDNKFRVVIIKPPPESIPAPLTIRMPASMSPPQTDPSPSEVNQAISNETNYDVMEQVCKNSTYCNINDDGNKLCDYKEDSSQIPSNESFNNENTFADTFRFDCHDEETVSNDECEISMPGKKSYQSLDNISSTILNINSNIPRSNTFPFTTRNAPDVAFIKQHKDDVNISMSYSSFGYNNSLLRYNNELYLEDTKSNSECRSISVCSSDMSSVDDSQSCASLMSMPREILLLILQYLNPQDLLRVASVNSVLNSAAYDPMFWKVLYPTQWAHELWTWNDQLLAADMEVNAVGKSYRDVYISSHVNFKSYDEDHDDDSSEPPDFNQRLNAVMEGLLAGVCRHVGSSVQSIVLDAAGTVCSRTLNKMLILCPNITRLSAAYCSVDYLVFKGLWQHNALQNLEELILDGCVRIDDIALSYLARCLAKAEMSSKLRNVSLSGCYILTSTAIECLTNSMKLMSLQNVNLSGCDKISNSSLNKLLAGSPSLDPERLSYCDNIKHVTGEQLANGCFNLAHPLQYCCRTGE